VNRTDEIINFVRDMKKTWKTTDPMILASTYGVRVMYLEGRSDGFRANTIKFPNYPPIISLNNNLSWRAKTVLCAHELGHALLHEGVNHFDVTRKNLIGNEEYEANLFAVALLFDEDEFKIPLKHMSNSLLMILLQYNID